ncbi:MAG: zinc transporter ZupT [Dehalococcoidales bacterium]|jgi:ZIP family zinc transporter
MQFDVGYALLLTTLAGLATTIGGLICFFYQPKGGYLALMLGFSAGVMVYISFVELLGEAVSRVGFFSANLSFFIGIAFIALLDIMIPHEFGEEHFQDGTTISLGHFIHRQSGRKLMPEPAAKSTSLLKRTGMLVALGIAIHNFPEGLAVFSSVASGESTLGLVVAVAVAIHNIPEGISVSAPIMEATGSRKKAFFYAFIAGMAEPVGAIIGFVVLLPFLTPALMSSLLAFAGGVMVYISFDELLPVAHRYGKPHAVIAGVVLGMLVMALSLYLLNNY